MPTRTLTINGETRTADVPDRMTLMRYLRDELGLVGTKDGCSTGDCGSCAVLVDGAVHDACQYLMRRTDDVAVETIESLGSSETLHPIQAAFLEEGAVQCGFCTPGMIMATKALLDQNPSPSFEEIRRGLKDNLCRCTGFVQIFEAVEKASNWLENPDDFEKWHPTYGPMGTSSVLVDGHKSVRGSLLYADDLYRTDMLHGQIIWSEHPYARIVDLDVSKAEGAPGVAAVLTAKDIPGRNAFGRSAPDQPVLCEDYVRFTGDPVAVVLAETKDEAVNAAKLVEVVYEVLEGVFSPADALREGAPQLVPTVPGNVCLAVQHEVGDVESAMAEAAHIVEGRFTTQRQDHAYLEPLSCLAEWSDSGQLTVYTPTQSPFQTHDQLIDILALPRERIRVIAPPLGGAFGGKLEIVLEGMVAVATFVTGRPVKITLSRAETLRATVKRHPYELNYRVAADAEGRLLGVDAELVCDGGPYTGCSPWVIDQGCIFSCGPYRIPNVRVNGKAVLTNNPLGGAFHGYGINQAAVAMEQLMDELALAIGADPFDLRRRNLLRAGDKTITGEILRTSIGAVPTLDACEAAFNEEWPAYQGRARPGYRIGFGIASAYKNIGTAGRNKDSKAGAIMKLRPGGRVDLRASVVDMGQAMRTTMVQLAAQATGIGFEEFDITSQDTELTIRHGCASGQRQTLLSGQAVALAGAEFRDKVLDHVARWHGLLRDDLAIAGHDVVAARSRERLMSLAEVFDRASDEGLEIDATVVHEAPETWPLWDKKARETVPPDKYKNYPAYAYCAQVAIVGVDEETGAVDLLRVIASQDVGVAINPVQIRGQIIGSISMGQGYALSENYPAVEGRSPWKRLDYRRLGVPTSTNATSVRVEIVEDPCPEGPFGAKGVSEVSTVPITPAILNAIHHATGVRIHDLPVDKDVIRKHLAGE